MKTPESYEKKAIKKYLDSIGAWYCSPMTFGYGASGVPDIIGCWNRHFFAIEVKREGREPTLLQKGRMARIQQQGGHAFWGTAEKVLKDFNRQFGPIILAAE